MKVFSWGHDWVVLALLICLPAWAPTRVFALPIAFRLYVHRQGLAKGKKKTHSGNAATLRRLSWEEKIEEEVGVCGPQQKWVADVTEWMARVG